MLKAGKKVKRREYSRSAGERRRTETSNQANAGSRTPGSIHARKV
jgi:hypothetical protein